MTQSYPNNFNLIDLIDTSYYRKKSVKVTVKTYKLEMKDDENLH